MHRLFQPADEAENISFINRLSTTSGWLNPFRLSSSSMRNMLVSSLGLVMATSNSVASFCFQSENGTDNLLVTDGYNVRALYDSLKDQCGAYRNVTDCTWWADAPLMYFGYGYFGGARCALQIHGNNFDPCIVDVLNNKVESGYGTADDIITTTGIVVGGVVALCTTGICLFKLKRACAIDKQNKILADASTPLISMHENKFYGLNERAILIDGENETTDLQEKLTAFKDNYNCAISLDIMQNPATLACGHSFELTKIRGALAVKSECPCCRQKVDDPDNIQVDEEKKKTITDDLAKLEDAIRQSEESSNDIRLNVLFNDGNHLENKPRF